MSLFAADLDRIYAKTKVVCFGRLQINVPADATVVYGTSSIEWPIVADPRGKSALDQVVSEIATKIESDRELIPQIYADRFPLYGKVMDGAVQGQKILYGTRDVAFYSLHSVIPVGGNLFIQSASGVLDPEESVRVMNKIARSLQPRTEGEIPSRTGVCLENGFSSYDSPYEETRIGIRLQEFPDVHLSIQATRKDALVESDALEPLVERARIEAQRDGHGAFYARIKVLRRGDRTLGVWNGFEILGRMPAHDSAKESHDFRFKSLAVPNDPYKPMMDIRMYTGVKGNTHGAVTTTLSDEEAVALWDRLTGSLRNRPVDDIKKDASPTPVKPPLGTYIESGQVCPLSGWWECSDEFRLVGLRKRFFTAGVVMPPSQVSLPRSVAQTILGKQPTREVSTHWKLVEYEIAQSNKPIEPSGASMPNDDKDPV